MAEEAQPGQEGGQEEPGGQAPAEEIKGGEQPPSEGETALTEGVKEKEPEGAPESYEAFNLPEGAEVDEAKLAEFTDLARELNLPQTGAQKLMDLYAREVQAGAEAAQQAWADVQETWKKEVQSDKEFGGAKLDESLGYARKVLQEYGTPELVQALKVTGVGNHPEFVRVFNRIGRAISEGDINLGSTEGQKSVRDPAKILFDHPGTPR